MSYTVPKLGDIMSLAKKLSTMTTELGEIVKGIESIYNLTLKDTDIPEEDLKVLTPTEIEDSRGN